MTLNALPHDRQFALAPLDEKVDHVRGSPTGRLIIEYGDADPVHRRRGAPHRRAVGRLGPGHWSWQHLLVAGTGAAEASGHQSETAVT